MQALVPRKWVLRKSILTALDSGKPAEEGEVVDAAPWCISCRPVQMKVQMQSLDAASCTPGAITATRITHATVSRRHTVAPGVRRDGLLCCSCSARTA